MRFCWPEDTNFQHLVLDVEQDCCDECGRRLHICDHRIRHLYPLEHPLELCCRLAHCPDPACSSRPHTLSPAAELSIALPSWLIGWDVFAFIGHRRFARHWSIPLIRNELRDSYRIALSPDAISVYLQRYQTMLAARQQDFDRLQQAYQGIDMVDLTIDGLQPEKGHETLYAVRELKAKRVWFAEALLSSNEDEVRRLLVRAKEMAAQLGKPIRLWMSDKQDAFVKGIAAEFSGVPHLYCGNHFLRDLAKPTLAGDSHAKVRMRKKVRGLRAIEREVIQQQKQPTAGPNAEQEQDEDIVDDTGAAPVLVPAPAVGRAVEVAERAVEGSSGVVLDYCAAVRGILNDDQGGALHPPGLRMAEALTEVRESLQRNLDVNKPGVEHGQLERLAGCIDKGLEAVKAEQQEVKEQVKEIERVADTLDAKSGTMEQRKEKYEQLHQEYEGKGGEFYERLAKVMVAWAAGLFLKVELAEGEKGPVDNLELERFFRNPKGHERRIHGHKHAGVRIVQEGPTLLLALDAHLVHDGQFTAEELLPYRHARVPKDQQEAISRRKVMRKARSKKNGPPCSES
jgi:prefoldin subunit 5